MIIDDTALVFDRPSLRVFESYVAALRAGFRPGSHPAKSEQDIQIIVDDPALHLADLNDNTEGTITLPNGAVASKVPYETLWLMAGEAFIGEVSFRHRLNENLTLHGGHVGYGIHPALQNRGYATLALKMTLRRAGTMGLRELLLTCAPDNPASERVILKNGGVYQDTLDNPFGFGPTKRFWVPVPRE